MANYIATDTELTSVANAIRAKGETSDPLVFPSGFVNAINAIPTGGGGGGITIVDTPDTHGGTIREIITNGDVKGVPACVEFIDYDGTPVTTKTKAQIEAMESDSDLPAFPSHTGLIAQGWNWTVAQLKAQLTAMPDQKVYVGQMYVTESGKTEIDVEMQEGRLDPILCIAVNGEVSVDWGDETTPDTITGSNISSRVAIPHTYANSGCYTIKISVISGVFRFYGGGNKDNILVKQISSSSEHYNKVYTNCVKEIRFGIGTNTIGNYSFYNCFYLTSITIPKNITSIGSTAFGHCHSLKSITIPDSITQMNNSMFSYCYSLVGIAIPSGVIAFSGSLFSQCSSLEGVTIPSNITSIGNSAFSSCSAIRKIFIPNGITSIGSSVFNTCISITNIVIPNGISAIENSIFASCQNIKSVTIPDSITQIKDYAFQNCYSLFNIIISNNVTTIGPAAFQNCYSLARITVPSSVTSIGNNAFKNCYGVAEYHILPTTPPTLGTTAFDGIQSDCIIYVPQGTLSAYQSATNWSAYASYMQEES